MAETLHRSAGGGENHLPSMKNPKLLLLKIGARWLAGVLRWKGVEVGRDPWILGIPDIKRAPGSRIVLGSGVSLFSARFANPLRPSGRTSLVTLERGASIVIEDDVGISSSVIAAATSIRIGAGSMIGADCLIMDTDFHGLPLAANLPAKTRPVVIGSRVFIGARSIVQKGVHIGDDSVIGAGSVVKSSIPAGVIAAGNPAVVLRDLSTDASAPTE